MQLEQRCERILVTDVGVRGSLQFRIDRILRREHDEMDVPVAEQGAKRACSLQSRQACKLLKREAAPVPLEETGRIRIGKDTALFP